MSIGKGARRKWAPVFALGLAFLASMGAAEVVLVPGEAPSAETTPVKKEFSQKGWYLNLLEVGRAWMSSPSDTTAAMDILRDLPGASLPGAMSAQFAGIYWPVGAQRKTLLGFMISGAGDPVFVGDKHWQLNQYIYALSGMYFPLGKIGDGLYVRGDVGAAALLLSGPGPVILDRSQGIGFLTGLGYVIPISDTVRPFVNLTYSLKSINGGSTVLAQGIYQSGGLDCGLLW